MEKYNCKFVLNIMYLCVKAEALLKADRGRFFRAFLDEFNGGVFLNVVSVVIDHLGLCRHVPLKNKLHMGRAATATPICGQNKNKTLQFHSSS